MKSTPQSGRHCLDQADIKKPWNYEDSSQACARGQRKSDEKERKWRDLYGLSYYKAT